jgi:hypothetical protein
MSQADCTAANATTLNRLLTTGGIRLHRGALFDRSPAPLPDSFNFDKVEGMLLGLAIGDALGAPTESQLPRMRQEQFGEVRDYLPNRYVSDGRGYPTDDTQLAFWLLDELNGNRGFVPDVVAARFASGHIFGIGKSVGPSRPGTER